MKPYWFKRLFIVWFFLCSNLSVYAESVTFNMGWMGEGAILLNSIKICFDKNHEIFFLLSKEDDEKVVKEFLKLNE